MTATPLSDAALDRVLADFGIPRSVLVYVNYPTHFDSRQTEAALEGTGIAVPPLEAYAGKLWDYWERHLDPDLFRDRTLLGAARGRLGLVGGFTQIIEQQIPDEVLRFGRNFVGNVSLEAAVRGRIVMVTGASSGIGKAAALKIADAGGTVLLVARTPEKLELTRDQILAGGGVAHIHQCDLSDFEDIDRMAEEVLAQHGHVDVLVNNAGRSIRRSIALSYDRPHDFERTVQLNYLGAVRLILKLLPVMRERKSGQIINISSIGVQTNMPRFSAYVASKSALDAFSRCIASEIIDDGVHITTINMPLVRTPMIAPTKMYDRFPTITPEEAADMITRGDHPQAEADRDADGDARADPLRAQPEVDRLHPQHRLPPVPGLERGQGRQEAEAEAGAAPQTATDDRRAGQQPADPVREPDARDALVGSVARPPALAERSAPR